MLNRSIAFNIKRSLHAEIDLFFAATALPLGSVECYTIIQMNVRSNKSTGTMDLDKYYGRQHCVNIYQDFYSKTRFHSLLY